MLTPNRGEHILERIAILPIAIQCSCPSLPKCMDWDFRAEKYQMLQYAKELDGNNASRCFGVELRIAHYFESRTFPWQSYFYQPSFRRLFLRPAIEPILFYNREQLRLKNLDDNAAGVFVSLSSGHPVVLHEGDQRSEPNSKGNFAKYPDVLYARKYLQRIKERITDISCPIARALFVFAEVILSHPYRDGNCRLARALLFSSLSADLKIDFVDLPLGVILTAYADQYVSALQALSATGNWDYYFTTMNKLLKISTEIGTDFLSPALSPGQPSLLFKA